MFDRISLQVIPNKTISHTNDMVNTLIQKVLTSNAVSSDCILIIKNFLFTYYVFYKGFRV